VEEWLEREKVNVKEAFKINKDKKKNIMLNKSRLKERKGKNVERKIQKKLREVAREEKDGGKRVKTEYGKLQINGEWFV
jgi:hypothetical protein